MTAKSTKNKNQGEAIPFGAFEISPTTAELAITLLQSKEPEVLWKTLRTLSGFAKQHYDNKVLLYNLNAVEYILPHIEHPHLNVKRFALLNLALLCLLPEVPKKILESPENMIKLAYLLIKIEDIFTLEYTSLCLSRLTTVPEGCSQLINANILGALFKRMKDSLDPDIQKNCLQTLINLLEDPEFSGEVTKNSFFNWAPILILTQSKFIGIQNAALKMVALLVEMYDDVAVQAKFRASTGVLDLCDILERYEFRDAHVEVLKILKMYVEPGINATHIYTAGCIPRLQTYLEMALPQLKQHCLAVLTTLSFTPEGREVLLATKTDLIFCDALVGSHYDMTTWSYAALGIANMCHILMSATRMCETGVARYLCTIIVDVSVPWFDVRINTLKALIELSRLTRLSAILVLKSETFTPIRQINVNYKDNPELAQMLALQCYQSVVTYTDAAMKVMLNHTFVRELIDVIRRVNIKLQLLAIKTMCNITQHELGRDLFTTNGGEQVISDSLKINHNGLREALCQLIIDSVTYEGAEVYLDLGTMIYMSENLSARFSVKMWDKALAKMLEKHPSAKFGILGKLEINDVTNDGFYVLKRLGENFPSIGSIMSKSPPGVNPVYIAILHPDHRQRSSVDLGIRTPYSKHSHGCLSSVSLLNSNLMALLPDDNNLKDYVYRLRYLIGDPKRSLLYVEIFNAHYDIRERKKCEEIGSILIRKAEILAEFVVREMNGCITKKEDIKCCMPNVELHIADLMNNLKTNVIGIGFVRYGGMLERAIMYKVLADRVGLPCAIYRKCSRIAWCSIAVPEDVEPIHTEEKFPAKYLRSNYVVNLNDNAKDRLHLEGSHEANRICGPRLPPYVVGKRTCANGRISFQQATMGVHQAEKKIMMEQPCKTL